MATGVQASPGVQLTPAPSQTALPSNYITDFNFLNQYLPDTYSEEFERYGNRSIASFLRLVGAEYPSNSDLVKWTEQGRLHTIYTDLEPLSANGTNTSIFESAGGVCTFRVNQTVLISDNASDISGKAIISAVGSGLTAGQFTVEWYAATGQPAMVGSTLSAFVYGSEFRKGSKGMEDALEAVPEFFSNKPIIIKDHYEVSGSDMAQIGWVNVDNDENGANGYYWYLQSAGETRTRFEDYMEMGMIEGVKAGNGSGAEAYLSSNTTGENAGTEGLFEAIETGGNVWSAGNPTALSDWDAILKRLDKQGSIKENVIFNNRDMSIDIDDMLGTIGAGYSPGGTSYGMFSNSEQMALNLGFDGFSRGSYEFYKTDWKYLNDATLRGGITGGKVSGVLVPAGEKSVYDQMLGKNVTRPFLHVRYRSSPTEDRKYKTYILGGAGGAETNNIDSMNVEFLTERTLCTMGRNNFFIFQG